MGSSANMSNINKTCLEYQNVKAVSRSNPCCTTGLIMAMVHIQDPFSTFRLRNSPYVTAAYVL